MKNITQKLKEICKQNKYKAFALIVGSFLSFVSCGRGEQISQNPDSGKIEEKHHKKENKLSKTEEGKEEKNKSLSEDDEKKILRLSETWENESDKNRIGKVAKIRNLLHLPTKKDKAQKTRKRNLNLKYTMAILSILQGKKLNSFESRDIGERCFPYGDDLSPCANISIPQDMNIDKAAKKYLKEAQKESNWSKRLQIKYGASRLILLGITGSAFLIFNFNLLKIKYPAPVYSFVVPIVALITYFILNYIGCFLLNKWRRNSFKKHKTYFPFLK